MYVIIQDDERYVGPKNNIVNISRRRCRIGKVTLKPAAAWQKRLSEIMRPQPVVPTSYPPAWWQNPVVSTR